MAENKNKKNAQEADEYFLCTHVDSDGYQYELLLTKREFDIGVARAVKNPEDIPENFIVLQGYKKNLP
jgi:hypothetical protein